jgi:hypothetical protein
MNKKLLTLSILAIMNNQGFARPVSVGDIVGHEFYVSHLGWVGQVGLGFGIIPGQPTNAIIEVVLTPPVIQINSLDNFKTNPYPKVKHYYWGNRWGYADSAGIKMAIDIASYQRLWCPKYTFSDGFIVGAGNSQTGQPTKCGMWNSHTLIGYSFYVAGYPQILNSNPIGPLHTFIQFPYYDTAILNKTNDNPPKIMQLDKNFSELTTEELNTMSHDEFKMIADIPLEQETPTHIETEWRFASDPLVDDIKRGIFIDRLSLSNEQDVITKFIKMYKETNSKEIKSRLIQGTMIYYQQNWESFNNSSDNSILKDFYADLLHTDLSVNDMDNVIRGFVDLSSSKEILEEFKLIDKKLANIEPNLLIGLKFQLAFKSKELEKLYIPSIITMLKQKNDSDLDYNFFTMIRIANKNLKVKESKIHVLHYMNHVKDKYMSLHSHDYDLYLSLVKNSYTELQKLLNNQ